METLDLAILGGGPAGLTLALSLERLRAPGRMAVFEKERYPRFKPCAGGVAARVGPVLERLEVPLPAPRVAIEGVRIRFRERAIDIEWPGLGWVIRRDVLDGALARAARARRIDLREGTPVLALRRARGGFVLDTGAGPVRARAVAVCTGASGRFQRTLGRPEAVPRARLLLYEGPRGPADPADRFVFDLSLLGCGVQGYAWDFPFLDAAGHPRMNRGIMDVQWPGRERFPRAALPDLVRARARAAGAEPGAAGEAFFGFSERPFAARAAPLVLPGAIFVGEAAGIDPLVGEGIAESMQMAALAARAVDAALRRSRDGVPHFCGYHGLLARAPLGRALAALATIARVAYGRCWPAAVEYLFAHPDLVREYCAHFAGAKHGRGGAVRHALGLAWAIARYRSRTWIARRSSVVPVTRASRARATS